MLYKTLSAAVYGIDANIIEVEVDVSGIKTSEDHFHTVGLPDAAVRESRDRVRSALKNCGYDIPPTHITINLAPADIRKEGSGFDLPMALLSMAAFGAFVEPSPSPLKRAAEKSHAWWFRSSTPGKPLWFREDGGKHFCCCECGSHFDTSVGYAKHQVNGCAIPEPPAQGPARPWTGFWQTQTGPNAVGPSHRLN